MKIRTLVMVPIVAIFAITIVLVSVIGNRVRGDAHSDKIASIELQELTALLAAQAALVAEREPTLDAFAADSDAAAADRLAQARAQTDRALQEVAETLGRYVDADTAATMALLRTLAGNIAAARNPVDLQLRRPQAQRAAVSMATAMLRLVRLVTVLAEPLNRATAAAVSANPNLMTAATLARLAGDMDDFAGQMAVLLRPLLRARAGPVLADVLQLEEVEGHLQELDRQLGTFGRLVDNDAPELGGALHSAHDHYVGEARLVTGEAIGAGLGYLSFKISAAEFVRQYSPTIAAIRSLQGISLQAAHRQIKDNMRLQRLQTIVIAAAGLAVVVIVIGALLALRWRVIDPLVATADVVVRLANGERDVAIAIGRPGGEIAALAEAIGKLREAAITADLTAEQRRGARARQVERLQQVCQGLEAARADVERLMQAAETSGEHLRETAGLLGHPTSQAEHAVHDALAGMAESCVARLVLLRDAVAGLTATANAIEAEVTRTLRAGSGPVFGQPEGALQEEGSSALANAAAQLQSHAAAIGETIGSLNQGSLAGMTQALPAIRAGALVLPPRAVAELLARTTGDAQATGSAFARLRQTLLAVRAAIDAVAPAHVEAEASHPAPLGTRQAGS